MKLSAIARRLPAALLATVALAACGGGGDGDEALPFGLISQSVTPASQVSDIVFAPDGRIFFAEQYTGNIRIVNVDGTVQAEPFAKLEVANWLDLDWGLTGLALDPDFDSNGYVYAFYSEPATPQQAPSAATGTESPSLSPTPAGQTVEPSPSASPAPAPATTGVPQLPTPLAPGQTNVPAVTAAPSTPGPTQPRPVAQPVLVRFTDRDGKGEERTVISADFPVTAQDKAGYNANGNIHFGPDGMLYLSVGDYDYGAANGLVQDLASPIGKLLRIDPATGGAPADNPFADDGEADPRVFAYGFRDPFDFAFDPGSEAIYGTDNTPVTCEELNIIRAGQDYGWPDVGGFPFSDCEFGDQVRAIHFFARQGKQRGEFISFVEVAGLAFAPGSRYPALGDSLFVCEGHRSLVDQKESPGVLRRLVLSGDSQISGDDVITKDCKGDVSAGLDGTIYYANATEILRLLPGATGSAGPTTAAPSP